MAESADDTTKGIEESLLARATEEGIEPSLLDNDERLKLELEFVLALANLDYVKYLGQRGHLQDEAFIRYLAYLQYFKRPEYVRLIVYPQALQILDLLQDEEFRARMRDESTVEMLKAQQRNFWRFHRQHSIMEAMGMEVKVDTEHEEASESTGR